MFGVSFIYDTAGNRIAKSANNGSGTTTTRFVNDVLAPNALVLAETDTLNDIQRYNIWGPNGLVSTGDASTTSRYYPLTDHHGSVRLLTDASGNVINSYEYTTYGEVTTASSTPVLPYRYTSEQHDDETGLIYLRARYYDPSLGRFISRDPFRGTLDSSLSQHTYQYGLNNPVRYSDPSGEFVPVLIGAWALAELGLTAYDGYSAYNTANDPCASDAEKALASSLFVAGIIGPGGGYGSVGKSGKFLSKGKPVDAPSGTKAINKILNSSEVHKIKHELKLEPDDDVFVTPDGDILITGQGGKAEFLGSVEDFRY